MIARGARVLSPVALRKKRRACGISNDSRLRITAVYAGSLSIRLTVKRVLTLENIAVRGERASHRLRSKTGHGSPDAPREMQRRRVEAGLKKAAMRPLTLTCPV